MPSKARKAFDENLTDVDRLLELHESTGGTGRGRRFDLEVLNKSAIVLLTSHWEAYCEDIAAEALNHIVKHAKSSEDLPLTIKKLLAKELKGDSHELAVWKLADDKWRPFLLSRLEKMAEIRGRSLNTPKAAQVDELFKATIGLERVSSSWRWSKRLTVDGARKKLDRFVELRGAIAHRGSAKKSVTKAQATDYRAFLMRLSGKTGGNINTHVKKITGKSIFTNKKV